MKKEKYNQFSKWANPFKEPVNVNNIKAKKVEDETELELKKKRK